LTDVAHGADAASPAAPIDPVLREILGNEVALHAGVIDAWLAECAATPLVPGEPVVRAVHTLHGAITMVEIDTVAAVLAPLETYVKRLRAASAPPAADGLAAMAECVELLRATMAHIEAGGIGSTEPRPDLVARIAALRDT